MPSTKDDQERKKEESLKQLRQEIEEKLLEQLPQETFGDRKIEVAQYKEQESVDDNEAKRVVEALLFSASKPLTVTEVKRILKGFGAPAIEKLIRELQADYETGQRSFRINEVAGGFEISTEPKYAPWILKLELQKKAKQATQSALETLAILAYKQPVTRAEIEDLRGVDVSGVLSTLMDRNLIKIVGRKEVPGRPYMYGTTEKFLEHFGLKSLNDLPNIAEIRSLVENSIRRDELLKNEKIIPVEQTGAEGASEVVEPPPAVSAEETPEVNGELTAPEAPVADLVENLEAKSEETVEEKPEEKQEG